MSEGQLTALRKILANSHRFVLAAMSIEAGLTISEPAPIRDAFRAFALGVTATLKRLAATLRGGAMDRSPLPDLREIHHELVQSGDPHFGRHALVNVETDRIVNSLNTLTDLIEANMARR